MTCDSDSITAAFVSSCDATHNNNTHSGAAVNYVLRFQRDKRNANEEHDESPLRRSRLRERVRLTCDRDLRNPSMGVADESPSGFCFPWQFSEGRQSFETGFSARWSLLLYKYFGNRCNPCAMGVASLFWTL